MTYFAFNINGAIDKGTYEISVQQVKEALEQRRLFPFLEEKLGRSVDLSLLDSIKRGEIEELFLDLSLAVDERRKLDVEQNGLCLLIAYSLELIQRIAPHGLEKSAKELLGG